MLPYDFVEARDLSRVYGRTRALWKANVTFRAGHITSLEGPNGAGKSTLLSLLATLAKPTSGTLHYGTLTPEEDLEELRPTIGLVAHEALVYPDLTITESLEFYARMYELEAPEKAVREMLTRYGLEELAKRTARTLSRGQLQRLSLARAQLHDPALLLFDEPTTGLDTASTERVALAMEEARERKRIVVVVTHERALAERVADVRVFLERGKIVRVEERGRTL